MQDGTGSWASPREHDWEEGNTVVVGYARGKTSSQNILGWSWAGRAGEREGAKEVVERRRVQFREETV